MRLSNFRMLVIWYRLAPVVTRLPLFHRILSDSVEYRLTVWTQTVNRKSVHDWLLAPLPTYQLTTRRRGYWRPIRNNDDHCTVIWRGKERAQKRFEIESNQNWSELGYLDRTPELAKMVSIVSSYPSKPGQLFTQPDHWAASSRSVIIQKDENLLLSILIKPDQNRKCRVCFSNKPN